MEYVQKAMQYNDHIKEICKDCDCSPKETWACNIQFRSLNYTTARHFEQKSHGLAACSLLIGQSCGNMSFPHPHFDEFG